jgi:hypothetical protein
LRRVQATARAIHIARCGEDLRYLVPPAETPPDGDS